jgi:hypothetical protein
LDQKEAEEEVGEVRGWERRRMMMRISLWSISISDTEEETGGEGGR